LFKHEGVRWIGRPGKVAEETALSARVKQRITG
jgi:hypothetical protein